MLTRPSYSLRCLLTVGLFALVSASGAPAQSTAPAASAPARSVPALTLEQQEEFLRTADVVSAKPVGTGTTNSTKAILSDGKLRHDVHVQTVDVFKPTWRGKSGTVEKNFKDTYKFNIAAYRVGRLLGMQSIPPSVERDYVGKPAAYTWWADNVWITEMERRDKKIEVPKDQVWVNQLNTVRMFDQLIANSDRNQGNLLITPDWRVILIDHTRAFRTNRAVQSVSALTRVDYKLFQSLKKMTRADVERECSRYLSVEEIDALMARHAQILKFYETEITQKGDVSVLTDMPRTTPQVSVP